MLSSSVFTDALGDIPICLPTVRTGSRDRQPYAAYGCPAWQGEKKLLILHKTKMQRNRYGFLKNVTTSGLSAAHPDSHSQALQAKACLLGYLSCFMQCTCSYHMQYKQYKVQLAVITAHEQISYPSLSHCLAGLCSLCITDASSSMLLQLLLQLLLLSECCCFTSLR